MPYANLPYIFPHSVLYDGCHFMNLCFPILSCCKTGATWSHESLMLVSAPLHWLEYDVSCIKMDFAGADRLNYISFLCQISIFSPMLCVLSVLIYVDNLSLFMHIAQLQSMMHLCIWSF